MIRVCGFFHFCSEKRYGEKSFDFSPPSLFLPEILQGLEHLAEADL